MSQFWHSVNVTYNYEIICFSFRYYADIQQTASASDQEMNSSLAEISHVGDVIVFIFFFFCKNTIFNSMLLNVLLYFCLLH